MLAHSSPDARSWLNELRVRVGDDRFFSLMSLSAQVKNPCHGESRLCSSPPRRCAEKVEFVVTHYDQTSIGQRTHGVQVRLKGQCKMPDRIRARAGDIEDGDVGAAELALADALEEQARRVRVIRLGVAEELV